MTVSIAFVVGCFVGVFFGVLAMALVQINKPEVDGQ